MRGQRLPMTDTSIIIMAGHEKGRTISRFCNKGGTMFVTK